MSQPKPNLKVPSKIQKLAGSNLPTSSALSSSSHSLASIDISLKCENYSVGERVWVNGTKPGVIRFLGPTQFAPGDWAGIALDQPVGKNNGVVEGIEYFQCKPQHGILTKLSKLTKEPITMTNTVAKHLSPRNPSSHFNLGERVCIQATSGSKTGILHYLGPTEFASGDWAGVELDEPFGKNDGSVAGKRYFTCEPKYGLFAPIYKVSKAISRTSELPNLSEPIGIMKKTKKSEPIYSQQKVSSGSLESLNSSISSTSSLSRNRIKLGINSLKTTSSKATASPISNGGIQNELKEKEEYISKLIEERDLERLELSQVTIRAEKAEKDLSIVEQKLHFLSEEKITLENKVKILSDEMEKTRQALLQQIEEDKSKIEDLQFRLEEESISQVEISVPKIADLQEENFKKDETILHLESQLGDQCKKISSLKSSLEKMELEKMNLLAKLKDKKQESSTQQLEIMQIQKLKEDMEIQVNLKNREFEEIECGYKNKFEELERKLNLLEIEKVKKEIPLQERISTLETKSEEEKSYYEQQYARFENEIKQITQEYQFIKKERDTVLQELSRTKEAHAQTKEKMSQVTDQLKLFETEFSSYKEHEYKKNNDLVQELQQHNKDLHSQIISTNCRLKAVTTEKDQLTTQLKELQINQEKLLNEHSNLQQQLASLNQREQELVKFCHDQKLLLENKSNTIDSLEKQIKVQGYEEEKFSKILKEKQHLEEKLVDLQVALAHSSKIKEENVNKDDMDALHIQIEFLNSVIVDLHHKNDQLKSQIESFEKVQEVEKEKEIFNSPVRLPPRKFCDHCDRFDLHETEECPKEKEIKLDQAFHFSHQNIRGEVRPYCDHCEIFGHWTVDCKENETF